MFSLTLTCNIKANSARRRMYLDSPLFTEFACCIFETWKHKKMKLTGMFCAHVKGTEHGRQRTLSAMCRAVILRQMKCPWTHHLPMPWYFFQFAVFLKYKKKNQTLFQVEGISTPFGFMFPLDWGDAARRFLAHALLCRLWLMFANCVYWESCATFSQPGLLIRKRIFSSQWNTKPFESPIQVNGTINL